MSLMKRRLTSFVPTIMPSVSSLVAVHCYRKLVVVLFLVTLLLGCILGGSSSSASSSSAAAAAASAVEVQWQATVTDLSVVVVDTEEDARFDGRVRNTNETINSVPSNSMDTTKPLRASGSVPNRHGRADVSPTTAISPNDDTSSVQSLHEEEEVVVDATTESPPFTCRMYLAPSTIPGAGLGSFAGVDFRKGDEVTPGDAVVPIADIAYHNGGSDHVDTFLWDEYIWSGDTFNYMSEPHHDIDGASFGIGAVPNCLFPLLNVRDTHTLDRDYGSLDRTSPAVGAFTPWHNRRSYATQSIRAGAELFVDYGYNYFKGERVDIYGWIPFLPDFKKADALLVKYTATVQSLVRTAWKQCLIRTDDAVQRKAQCQRSVIEELPAFAAFKDDLYTLAKQVMSVWPPTRTYGALPTNATTIPDLLHEGGTIQRDFNRSHVNVSYLEEHGSCMDNLVAQPSTMAVAGRGAFATRSLARGNVVAPVPLIHLPDRRALDIYPGAGDQTGRNASDAPIHEQLLVNYCFGHAQSTLLLCPYGVVSSLVNHAPSPPSDDTATISTGSTTTTPSSSSSSSLTANVKIVWSTKLSAHLEWRDQPIQKWAYSYQAGLGFEYVALRDIGPGEEILLDYGREWQTAWDAHVAGWTPMVRRVDELNAAAEHIPTEQEWRWSMGDPNTNPDAVNLWCYSVYRELQGLKPGAHDSYPCKVVLRQQVDGVVYYTAEVVHRRQRVDEDTDDSDVLPPPQPHCTESFDEVLWVLPRDAFAYGGVHERFDTREYGTPGTFRHPMGLPADLMPDVWKNKV